MTAAIPTPLQPGVVPVILVSGVREGAMGSAAISLLLGLPDAVAVRHTIDAERRILTRIVSDVTGILEHEELDLAHACVSCAIREDIVPALERLASSGRWSAIVACLPVAADARQVCRVLAWSPRDAPHAGIAAVVVALDGATVAEDLLGDDLLRGRGWATSDDDERGLAEVGGAMVEYADVVCATEAPDPDELALLRALARPGVPVVTDPSMLDAATLAAGVHGFRSAEDWVGEVRRGALPPLPPGGVWRLDLRSDRPLHPRRFYDELAVLGSGPRRSRGCFWLPTRPGVVCVWDGAGGQVGVGAAGRWAGRKPLTRITIIGLDDDMEDRAAIAEVFHRCLLTDDELDTRGRIWDDSRDGFEPWLGPIERAAQPGLLDLATDN